MAIGSIFLCLIIGIFLIWLAPDAGSPLVLGGIFLSGVGLLGLLVAYVTAIVKEMWKS